MITQILEVLMFAGQAASVAVLLAGAYLAVSHSFEGEARRSDEPGRSESGLVGFQT